VADVKARADAFARQVASLAQGHQAAGLSLGAIARQLNADGIPTARGARWTPGAVARILARVAN
jgi:hypothetical protein